MKVSVKVKGMEELVRNLSVLQVSAKVRVAEAVRETSKELRKEARTRVPRKSGAFAKRIRTKFSKDQLTARTAAFARSGRPHPLSHIIEFGTKPHSLAPKAKRALTIGDGFAASAQHPGTAAKPWLFPSFEAVKPKYVSLLEKALNLAGEDAASGRAPNDQTVTEDGS